MCGIAAVYSISGGITDATMQNLTKVLMQQERRGPDFMGFKRQEKCILGHNRLSIIDLSSTNNQPMSGEDGTEIVFNGEIFNFRELRALLESKGHVFRTNGDTEVLLRLYKEFGQGCVEKIRGQFAFAIYDSRNHELFIARDQLGIKPLFYTKLGEQFYIASSFKALVAVKGFRLNRAALHEYFSIRNVLPPDTLAQGIYQMEPGCCALINRDGIQERRYWDIKLQQAPISYTESVAKTYESVSRSIEEQLVSNAPIGIFLSGGLDSSIVAAELAKHGHSIRSFSIRFSEFSDEENRYAALMAQAARTSHHVYDVKKEDIDTLITDMVTTLDQPTGARDCFAMFLLSKYVKEVASDIKVILTGTGADEFFNGYMNSYFRNQCPAITSGSLKSTLEAYVTSYGFLNSSSSNLMADAFSDTDGFREVMLNKLERKFASIVNEVGEVDGINFHNLFYSKVHLVGWELPVADDTTSSFSLESRVPFVSPEIADFVFSVPGDYKYRDGVEKSMLREAFRNVLPQEIYSRPKGPFSRQVMNYLEASFLSGSQSEAQEVARMLSPIRNDVNVARDHSDYFWRALILDKWLRANGIGSLLDVCLDSEVLSAGNIKAFGWNMPIAA